MNALQRAGGSVKQPFFLSAASASSAGQGPSVVRCVSFGSCKWASLRWVCRRELQRSRYAPLCVAASSVDAAASARPSPAEAARTLADADGSPVFYLPPSAFHSHHLQGDSRCSLHIQLEQPGHRKPQCTFKGRVSRVEGAQLIQKLRTFWCRRFREEPKDDDLYLMNIESILQSLDIGEDSVLVSDVDYREASPDPLRECAAKIVEDMNRNHWEDLRRFCKVYGHLDLSVEEARLSWVDRLGFDMRVLTSSQDLVEVRIPFSREVVDERDARSSLTMMAQISWEYERNYNPPEIQLVKS
ncbi:hypothetical protein GOP47_0028436 [Adiantum capillus-veneris]|nr:hypothetical protein GOP47_0028436 [Adiantum capillus-veneris]